MDFCEKKKVRKLVFGLKVFFIGIRVVRGYFWKIMWNGEEGEVNLKVVKWRKMEGVELVVVVEVWKKGLEMVGWVGGIFEGLMREEVLRLGLFDFGERVV